VSLCADRLVLRVNRGRTVVVPVQVKPDDPEWRAALEALPGILATHASHEVSVVLADQFVRYALLPWNAALKSHEQWLALARHRLGTVHGSAAAEWDLKLTETAPEGPRLACAVDRALVAALAAAAQTAGARLVSVQPFLVAAFNRLKSGVLGKLGAGSCWLVIEEPGRLTLCFIQRGIWAAVRSRRTGAAWRELLPDLIERESAFLALSERCTRVIVCAQGEFDAALHEAFDTNAVSYSELALARSEA
jgi:hypothetical protein